MNKVTRIVNLTGVSVVLQSRFGSRLFEPEKHIASVIKEEKHRTWIRFSSKDVIELRQPSWKNVINLPDPAPDTVYLVRKDVLDAVETRHDVVSPYIDDAAFSNVIEDGTAAVVVSSLIGQRAPVVYVGEYEPPLVAFNSK